jgi:bifunctional NMN adenylyltransferase/nudix hydrolase
MHDVAVYIGRFQPYHMGHHATVRQALEAAKELVILIGSSNSARTAKNPFTWEERRDMIKACLTEAELARVSFRPLRDFRYNDDHWIASVVNTVREIHGHGARTALIGYHKDASSYYLGLFPDWHVIPMSPVPNTDATEIRRLYFDGKGYAHMLPAEGRRVDGVLRQRPVAREDAGRRHPPPRQPRRDGGALQRLQREHWFIREYRKQWAGTPYEPTFVTADAVVTCSGHVLVITRKDPPGEGLLAVPGGFIRPDETLYDAVLRELKEETDIRWGDGGAMLPAGKHVFDNPGRSLRGRTITHAFHFHLTAKFAPSVKGGDDARTARWMPIRDAQARKHRSSRTIGRSSTTSRTGSRQGRFDPEQGERRRKIQ